MCTSVGIPIDLIDTHVLKLLVFLVERNGLSHVGGIWTGG